VHAKIHGRRLAGGSATLAALAANYSAVALYNDSTIGHLLRVVNWQASVTGGASVAFMTQGALSTLVGRGIPLFAGENAPAGLIYTQQDVNAPPMAVFTSAGGASTQSPEITPWFYLRPGYSLVIKTQAVNLPLLVSFWWEDLTMDMLSDHELE
jgi:hypothetical protein